MIEAWLEGALQRARDVQRKNAQAGVSSYQGGYDVGWITALETASNALSLEGNQTMNFFKMLQVAGEIMSDLPSFEAMVAGLMKGQMPTQEEIARLMKLITDAKAAL